MMSTSATKIRIVSTILAIIMLIGILPIGTSAVNFGEGGTYVRLATASSGDSGYGPLIQIGSSLEYYGRSAIAKLDNADNLLYVYDKLVEGIENSDEEIILFDSTHTISADDVAIAMDAYRRDHVEHFWLSTDGYGLGYLENGSVYCVAPIYSMSGDTLTAAKTAFNNAVDELLDGISSSMSEYEREKLIHDRLAAKITYGGYDTENAYTPYGALVEGTAVCEGYAEAFQYLLYKAGIQSFLMYGSSVDPSDGVNYSHEWNAVRIDGKYYHVDLTWDDQGENIFYAYFNKTDTDFAEDHTTQTAAYDLPVCNSTDADYFVINGGKMASFNADSVAERIKAGDGVGRIYVTGDLTEFTDSLKTRDNITSIYNKLGYSNAFSYVNLGREIIITLLPKSVKLDGSIVCYGSADIKITIELYAENSTDAAYTLTVTGTADSSGKITAAYSFGAVVPDSYTMKVSKTNHVSREYSVKPGASGLTQNAEIWLKGDVNGDGKISVVDSTMIASHIKKTSLLTGYALECADVNGDEKISVVDSTMVASHIKKTSLLW